MSTTRFARSVVALTCLTLPTFLATTAASSSHETPVSPAISCQALSALALPHSVITSATVVPAQGSAPEYCRVLATAEPETDIEIRLPNAWAKRLLHLGGTGFDGVIPVLNTNVAELQAGYALTASNGGHRDPARGATRFLDNATLIDDYAHAAIEKTVHVAKAVIAAYYGRPAKYSYFSGCSNGGREALNAAAHYGDEYDGVVAGAPAVNITGLISRWTYASRLTPPSAAKLAALDQAQTSQCDGQDGLLDGIIGNPAACSFDPASLRCPSNAPGDSCLTDPELQVVQTLRTDLTLENGRLVYPRYGIGNPSTGLGVFMRLGPPGTPTLSSSLSGGYLPYIVYSNPAYNTATYDIEVDRRTVVDVMERTYDFSANTNPLARYLRSGKKIIVWQGMEDTLVSHLETIHAYEKMTHKAGGDSDNARLYTLPGVQHCGGGPGVNRFDTTTALAGWVEQGVAPHTLVASRNDAAGTLLFTRPVCEFPRYPHYDGAGDPADASNFRCVKPARQQKKD